MNLRPHDPQSVCLKRMEAYRHLSAGRIAFPRPSRLRVSLHPSWRVGTNVEPQVRVDPRRPQSSASSRSTTRGTARDSSRVRGGRLTASLLQASLYVSVISCFAQGLRCGPGPNRGGRVQVVLTNGRGRWRRRWCAWESRSGDVVLELHGEARTTDRAKSLHAGERRGHDEDIRQSSDRGTAPVTQDRVGRFIICRDSRFWPAVADPRSSSCLRSITLATWPAVAETPCRERCAANSSSRDQSSGFSGIFWIFVAPSRDGRPPVERTLISSCRRSACRLIGAP